MDIDNQKRIEKANKVKTTKRVKIGDKRNNTYRRYSLSLFLVLILRQLCDSTRVTLLVFVIKRESETRSNLFDVKFL